MTEYQLTTRKIWLIVPIIFLLLVFVVWPAFKGVNQKPSEELRLIMFDIGQGDALFIETPKRHQVLVDGGPSEAILEKLALVMPSGDRTIDALVISHPHADHLAGFVSVLKKYQVGAIYYSGAVYASQVSLEFLRQAKLHAVPLVDASLAPDLVFEDGVELDWLAPRNSFSGKRLINVHDAMVVARLKYQNDFALLAGDMETELEKELLESGEPLAAEVLKIGHHGSRTSTSTKFLSAVNPKFALISVGLDNSYGHPHAEVLRRLERFRVITFRTDRDRDIIARTSGKGWQIARQELRFFSDFVTFFRIRSFFYSPSR